jgi:hypothetical protein
MLERRPNNALTANSITHLRNLKLVIELAVTLFREWGGVDARDNA